MNTTPNTGPEEARAALDRASRLHVPVDRGQVRTLRLAMVGGNLVLAALVLVVRSVSSDWRLAWAVVGLGFVLMFAVRRWERSVPTHPRGYKRWFDINHWGSFVPFFMGLVMLDEAAWPIVWVDATLIVLVAVVCASRIGTSR